MALIAADAIGRREDGTLLFKCRECTRTIKSRPRQLRTHSGMCRSCCMRGAPFEHVYSRLKNTAKNESHDVSLTFDEFLELTQITKCYYCADRIPWQPYLYRDGEYVGGSYFLDRKNNNYGYSKENVVVCCSECNKMKSNRFTSEEFREIGHVLQKIRNERSKFNDAAVYAEYMERVGSIYNVG